MDSISPTLSFARQLRVRVRGESGYCAVCVDFVRERHGDSLSLRNRRQGSRGSSPLQNYGNGFDQDFEIHP
jgi:hypothetical protein